MAYEQALVCIALEAASDLDTAQYTFVTLDRNGYKVAKSGSSDLPIGVLQNKPKAGQMASIAVCGITKLMVASGTAAGDPLTVDTRGYGTTASAGMYYAFALEDAADDGCVIPALLVRGSM